MTTIVNQELGEILDNKIRDEVSNYFVSIHKSCLAKGASPRHFFTLNEAFKKIYSGKIQSSGN